VLILDGVVADTRGAVSCGIGDSSRPIRATLAIVSVLQSALAQEIRLTMSLKATPVGLYYWRLGRWIVARSTGSTLLRGYASLLIGGEGLFHPTDWLGMGTYSHVAIVAILHGICTESPRYFLSRNQVALLPCRNGRPALGYLTFDVGTWPF